MECEFPTVNATTQEEQTLMREAKTIAVVGLSPDSTKDSYRVASYLQNHGYTIIPVYPKGEEILGEKVYTALKDIPVKVDIVNVFRKSDAVGAIIDETIARGDVKGVWLQAGIVNNEAAAKGRENGLIVIQSRCLMVEHRKMEGGL